MTGTQTTTDEKIRSVIVDVFCIGTLVKRSCWMISVLCSITAVSTTRKDLLSMKTPIIWSGSFLIKQESWGWHQQLLQSRKGTFVEFYTCFLEWNSERAIGFRRSRGPNLQQKLKALYDSVKEHRDTKGRQLASIFLKLPSKTVSNYNVNLFFVRSF